MPKITCPTVECKYNSDKYICTARNVTFSEENLHTKWQGFRRLWECKTFERSKEYEDALERMKPILEKMKGSV